jgi:hypothetical protein
MNNKRGNVLYNITLRRVRATIVAVEKQRILHNLSVYFVALGILDSMRMRHIVIGGLPGSTIFIHIAS